MLRSRRSLVLVLVAGIAGTAAAQASSQAVDESATQKNIVVTHDRYLGHVEPDVAVNPRRPKNLIVACQFELGPRTRLPGTSASFDGGRTWQDTGLLPLPAGFEQGADTTVAFGADGEGYVVALLTHGGGGFASRVSRGGIFLWRTRDGGLSYSKPVPVYVGRGFQDHPWLEVSRARGATALFITWTNDSGLELSVSTDGGTTFSAPRTLVGGSAPSNPVLTLEPASTLSVFFEEFVGQRIRLEVVTSSDNGDRFGKATTIATVAAAALTGSGPKGGAVPPPLVSAATDETSGASAVAISVQEPTAGHPVIEVWEAARVRTDRWRGPFKPATGADAGLSQQQPRLLFARRHLYVSFFTTSRQGQTTENLAEAPNGSVQFVSQVLSDGSFHASGFIGDYQGLASSGSNGYALWNEARTGRLEIVAERFEIRRAESA